LNNSFGEDKLAITLAKVLGSDELTTLKTQQSKAKSKRN
jgi:hypothetical protein